MASLLINGDLSAGNADNWPGSPAYHASGGPMDQPYVTYPSGTRTVQFGADSFSPPSPRGAMAEGDLVRVSAWIKADKPGSTFVLEVFDADAGGHLSIQWDSRWQTTEGPEGGLRSDIFAFAGIPVPTAWTRITSVMAAPTAASIRLAAAGFNHSSGQIRDAAISISDLSLEVDQLSLSRGVVLQSSFENGLTDFPEGGTPTSVVPAAARTGALGYRVGPSDAAISLKSAQVAPSVGPQMFHVEFWARRGPLAPGDTRHIAPVMELERADGGRVALQPDAVAFVGGMAEGEWVKVGNQYPEIPSFLGEIVGIRFGFMAGPGETVVDIDDVIVVDASPDTPPKSGVTEVGVATTTREGIVGDVLARSRQKIDLKLALPDRRLRGGERIDLAAAAASASDVSWRWRQVTGPTVTLRRQGNTCSFIAPDVTETTPMRIAVSAATQEGGLRSNWEFFDLEITPTRGRLASTGPGVFSPHTPRMVGYSRGKRELWGDVLPPVGLDPEGRHDAEIVDIGFPADDVQVVADGAPPRRAPQGGVFIDLATGDVYQNFGEGYNEDEDTTGAPRRSAIMISPATGDVFQWIEGASDVG